MIDIRSADGEFIISFEMVVRDGRLQSWCLTNRFEPGNEYCAISDAEGNIECV